MAGSGLHQAQKTGSSKDHTHAVNLIRKEFFLRFVDRFPSQFPSKGKGFHLRGAAIKLQNKFGMEKGKADVLVSLTLLRTDSRLSQEVACTRLV